MIGILGYTMTNKLVPNYLIGLTVIRKINAFAFGSFELNLAIARPVEAFAVARAVDGVAPQLLVSHLTHGTAVPEASQSTTYVIDKGTLRQVEAGLNHGLNEEEMMMADELVAGACSE